MSSTISEDNVFPIKSKSSSIYDKFLNLLSENDKEIQEIKLIYDKMKTRQKQLKKIIPKIQSKFLKKEEKQKKNRKLCGFAKPSVISNNMCDFLGLDHGSMISRTEVTKSLIKYIKENELQNPGNKREIIMNETLIKLFGEDCLKEKLTYFTMQKYVNQHFPSNKQ